MADSQMASSLDQLPLEILQGIFYHLDIPDILRIRRVSRHLDHVSRCRGVWCDVYHRANFVRPPGPFLSQSAHDLESALVPSYRVDRNLRHGGGALEKEKQTRRVREIRYTGVALGVSLVFSRFLFVALVEEVRCYDLSLDAFDSNSGASIIYRSAGGRTLRSFHCVSAIDVQGRPFACAVFSEAALETTQVSICLLNVVERSEVTLDLLYQFEHNVFDIDIVDLGPRVIVIQGRVGPDVDTDLRLVAFDVHTRTRYLPPLFPDAMQLQVLEGIPPEEITSPKSISTSTHLLLAKSFFTQAAGWCTFLEALALPPALPRTTASHPLSTTLRPSHRGIVPGINVCYAVLLHDAVLDASTQNVLITLRVHTFEPLRPRSPVSRYGILCLGPTAHSTAPTAHHDQGGLGTVTFRPFGALGRLSRTPFLHPSFNGAGRAFYTLEPGSRGIVAALEYDVHVSDGDSSDGGIGGDNENDLDDNDDVGDGDGDGLPIRTTKVKDYPSILRFSAPRNLLDYDPYSGRICLQSIMTKYSAIEILDLAV